MTKNRRLIIYYFFIELIEKGWDVNKIKQQF